MYTRFRLIVFATVLLAVDAAPSFAAGGPHVDGTKLGLVWVLPFVGMLLSIALMPLVAPKVWHHHYGKVSAAWAIALIVPFTAVHGIAVAGYEVAHTALLEYFPFIVLLLALFTVTGGIRVTGNLHGSPTTNTALLAVGTALASWMGTTGAAMLLIRPLMRANDDRRHKAHVFVFFIFLVANIGGALTPLGDPPLLLGFLKGVPFFWPTTNLLVPLLLCSVVLLGAFFALDRYWYRREGHLKFDPTPDAPIRLQGGANIVLLVAIVGLVLMSGAWKPGVTWTIYHVDIELQNVVRDAGLLAITFASLKLTSKTARIDNGFTWGPILEVAKLFAAIFLTIIPAIAILRAGRDGALAPLVSLVTRADGTAIDAWYFWLSGILSSFLDNAPTYLVFFNLAGGDPARLTGDLASTLTAISCGAVFMGAMTYVGNAPNFMVKAIVEDSGTRMPTFFGYMVWSGLVLLPLFVVVTLVFFS